MGLQPELSLDTQRPAKSRYTPVSQGDEGEEEQPTPLELRPLLSPAQIRWGQIVLGVWTLVLVALSAYMAALSWTNRGITQVYCALEGPIRY